MHLDTLFSFYMTVQDLDPISLELACKKAKLVLQDGTVFDGYSFGADTSSAGEVVFNTGMVGYPESLTDPSYCGQILTLTFPLVGNYGVPDWTLDEYGLPLNFEGDRIWVKGLVISDYSFQPSHYSSVTQLGEWLKRENVPGIFGVDTRAVTKHIREAGSMLGKIVIDNDTEWYDPNSDNLTRLVSRKTPSIFTPITLNETGLHNQLEGDSGYLKDALKYRKPNGEPLHILVVDCGIKLNIIRYFLRVFRVKVTVVPFDFDFASVIDQYDGLFLSNGPGDPEMCSETIKNLKRVLERPTSPTIPIFGICLGNQLLALAAGAKTFKMKFGNRGMNQPCIDLRTSRCYITPQNHGFAVDPSTLPVDWTPLFVNANDGTNEGIIHRTKPWFSAQFHPEAAGGPTDTSFLFKYFLDAVAEPTSLPVTTVPYILPNPSKKVLVLGSGGLSIGQAGEFDYSGSQAIKALKEAGIESILINPNIATVQTSPGLADKVYFLPVTAEFVTQIIEKERPDGLFCTFGGQTALNTAVQLHQSGVLAKYNCRPLGTPIDAIVMTEDRELFSAAVETCGYKVAESCCCTTVEECVIGAKKIGYPVLVRAAYALGGLGSGFVYSEEELIQLVSNSFKQSSQVIIDKSLRGWKEFEYEVVRDCHNNCITVCNMENIDPMGIHTGDSIVIAPSQTLTNAQHFQLRKCALDVIRHVGVVGECNIQFALDPESDEFRIIEVNARLSRSSALASKATGYPLAYVAAKLALGHDLVSLRNSVTKSTTACFEPSLDYVVVKIPRWDLKKFGNVDRELGSCMKSVGEVMAIGRKFEETIQKALRMVDEASLGFDPSRFDLEVESLLNSQRAKMDDGAEEVMAVSSVLSDPVQVRALVETELKCATSTRMWTIAKAFDIGMTVDDVWALTRIDKWFLYKLFGIHVVRRELGRSAVNELSLGKRRLFELAKQKGFSDKQVASYITWPEEEEFTLVEGDLLDGVPLDGPLEYNHDSSFLPTRSAICQKEHVIRSIRKRAGILPVAKQIDTLAAEFPAQTNYLYLTYNGCENDVEPSGSIARGTHGSSPLVKHSRRLVPHFSDLGQASPRRPVSPAVDGGPSAVVVLGCGSYRIGSSVEFDWCSVSCVRTLRKNKKRAIVINCNPETVSTDFDESDRLYFEELSEESVLNVCDIEHPQGVVVSVGGQAPNNLAVGLYLAGVPILGTSVAAIDAAENRSKFSALCDSLRIDQPPWSQFTTFAEALDFCKLVDFPVLVRPSYVLSGAAMRVVYSANELGKFLKYAAIVAQDYPVVISKYVENSKEVEIDAVGADGEVVNYAISEHVQNAGVHSGDATLLLPAQKLYVETHRQVKRICQKLCRALNISGPFNIQFLCKGNEVKVIECNLRASRTMPFISKTFNVNFIEIATKVMINVPVRSYSIHPIDIEFVGCKVSQFSFQRLKGSDPRLGVEMRSTGEVAAFGRNQYEAFLKAMLSTGQFQIPKENILLSIGPHHAKSEFIPYAETLEKVLGFKLFATDATYEVLKETCPGIKLVSKGTDASNTPTATGLISSGKIDLVICVPSSVESVDSSASDGFAIRRTAVDCKVSFLSDIKEAVMFVNAMNKKHERESSGRVFFGLESWQDYQMLNQM
jgi:carbamoyl-phosphate synthase small subunit